MLSHQCFDFEDLQQTLKKILTDKLGVADGEERKALMEHQLAA